jgi:hypothetical protein
MLEQDKTISDAEELSEAGRYINKLANAESVMQFIMDAFDNADEETLSNPEVWFTYAEAVNQRLHVDEIPFNFQADKIFARHALVATEIDGEVSYRTKTVTKGDKETNQAIIDSIADEIGIFPEEVLGLEVENGTEPSILDGIDNMISDYVESNDLEGFLSLRNIRKNQWIKEAGNSPLHVWNLLKAIRDVRKAVKTQNTTDLSKLNIVTNYALEFDANQSGFVNKLLNALGSLDDDNRKTLMNLARALTVGKGGKLSDAYKQMADIAKKLIDSELQKAEESSDQNSKKMPSFLRN